MTRHIFIYSCKNQKVSPSSQQEPALPVLYSLPHISQELIPPPQFPISIMPRHLTASAPEAAPPPPAPPSDGGGRRPVPGDANFDTNMVIILAALLCALICALGLNSIVRCALRCGRRLAFETPAEAAARRTATGLKKKALRSIPVAVYGDGTAAGPAGPTWTECAICLGEFVEGEKVRVLPRCGHGFHVACVDTWLGSHSSCPTCRGSLIGGGGDDGAGSASASGSGVRDEVS